MLVVFAGLPGSGKTALARAVAEGAAATYVAVDTVVEAMLRAGVAADPGALTPTGYVVAEAVAEDCLAAGGSVVVDARNPTEAHRERWRVLAERRSVPLLFVEVVGAVPSAGSYEPWREPPLVIDNVGPLQRHVKRVVAAMAALGGG